MPQKGLFTQCAAILLQRVVPLDAMAAALAPYGKLHRREEGSEWPFSGPALVVPFRPDVNGQVVIDVVAQRWPDHMGDPQTDATLFGAWALGNFGPGTFPGGLERAGQQCWSWKAGPTIAGRHQAFLRVRSSYVFGGDPDAPVLPADYDSLAELDFVTDLASSLLDLPTALCYFNPAGEVLRDARGLRDVRQWSKGNDLPALEAWSNIRMFNAPDDWVLMDTIGNQQIDLPDIECCCPAGAYDYPQIDGFLRNITLYLLRQGAVVQDGDTMDGPGGVPWQVRSFQTGIAAPPRPTLRWFPASKIRPPESLLTGNEPNAPPT